MKEQLSAAAAGGEEEHTLQAEDAIMDPGITTHVEKYIAQSLISKGYDPNEGDLPIDMLYSIELNAVSLLIQNYTGMAKLCESLAGWCRELDDIYELFTLPLVEGRVPAADSPAAFKTSSGTAVANNVEHRILTPADYVCSSKRECVSTLMFQITEGLCMILSQNFQPDPFKRMLAAQDGSWAPPPFYWTLLRDQQVVDTFRRLYDRNRGSEFLGAFLQDYCERHQCTNEGFRVSSKGQLSEITAHFSIFTKAFGELLVDFLVDDDGYEFGDRDPHNISRLLCHAENAYCYAQALLHFLPFCQAGERYIMIRHTSRLVEFASCRRLAQLIFRNLRSTKSEYAAADRLLLCTALPNYPDLFELFKPLRETDSNGRMIITAESLIQISDALARVIRRFEKHNTLLLFQEGAPLPPTVTDSINHEEEKDDPHSAHPPHPLSWESEMLREDAADPNEVMYQAFQDRITSWRVSSGTDLENAKHNLELAAEQGGVEDVSKNPPQIIEDVEWPVSAEVKTKASLPVFWNLPSASQAGDAEIIQEEAEDESERRGSAKLILPPMDAIRETLLLDQLWEFLVCPSIPGQPASMPVAKLVELILMLTTLTNYELVIQHLQRQSLDDSAPDTWEGHQADRMFYMDEDHEEEKRPPAVMFHQPVHGMASPSRRPSLLQLPPKAQKRDSLTFRQSLSGDADIDSAMPSQPLGPDTPHASPPLMFRSQNTSSRPRIAASAVSSYLAKSQVPSILESSVYKNPHEGSRLRALKPDDPGQSKRLHDMFSCCAERIEIYKGAARKELYELYHLAQTTRGNDQLSDWVLVQLAHRCNTSAGASATLRFIEEALLPEDTYYHRNTTHERSPPSVAAAASREDPLYKATKSSIGVREFVFGILENMLLPRKLLEESFNGPVVATEETQNLRRRLISVAVSQIGIAEMPLSIPADKKDVLPWRAVELDWNAVVIPGYKLLFNMIRELLYCFDVVLLRETLEFVLVMCGTPYSPPFAEKLTDLLRAVALQNCFKFDIPINQYLRDLILRFMENLYSTWAPSSPPEKVLQQCQVVAEAVGLPPDQMPIFKSTHLDDLPASGDHEFSEDDEEDDDEVGAAGEYSCPLFYS